MGLYHSDISRTLEIDGHVSCRVCAFVLDCQLQVDLVAAHDRRVVILECPVFGDEWLAVLNSHCPERPVF